VAFLRPYTPEVAAFSAMWGNFWAAYDSVGHFAHVKLTAGSTAVDNQPNVTLPGQATKPTRLPGENVGQPWTDANGSAPR
jgi:phospholipid/cholesterol/gamma-HCH transport system substrate-binding protein